MDILEIENLKVRAGDKLILDDVSLKVALGQVCVIMGPNGSGKSTLASTLMGHPAYTVESGRISFSGKDITRAKPEERAALGLFLSFQQPREIAGVDYYPFLFEAYKSLALSRQEEAMDVFAFKQMLDEQATRLDIKDDWGRRYLNSGFSGGEKKKSEMLQLALLRPRLAIFDEVDSGLDVDALEVVGQAIADYIKPETSALIVTHYQRILKYVRADQVVVMSGGRIVAVGGPDLAARLEKEGFGNLAS